MRIVEDSPRYLRLRDRTIWISLVCFAAAAIILAVKFPTEGPRHWLLPVVLSLAIGLFFMRWTDLVCDRALGSCSLSRTDVFRRLQRRFAFGDITDIAVELSRDTDGGPPLCRLVLTTTSGAIPLTASFEPDQERYAKMREALAKVIFNDRARPEAADPIATMLRAGRRIDAIALLRQREGLSLTEAHRRIEAMRREMAAEVKA